MSMPTSPPPPSPLPQPKVRYGTLTLHHHHYRHNQKPIPPPPPGRYGTLTFRAPDRAKYPALDLAYAAGRSGGTMTGVLSAANEQAVEMFIDHKVCGVCVCVCV